MLSINLGCGLLVLFRGQTCNTDELFCVAMEQPPHPDNLLMDANVAEENALPRDAAIVSAGEEDEGHIYNEHDDDDDADIFSDDDDAQQDRTQHEHDADELLYDAHMDEDDEAYVYQYLRGGGSGTMPNNEAGTSVPRSPLYQQETPAGADTAASNNDTHQSLPRRQQKAQKKRHSDAVLSCPACFNIVCMDCQRHERYPDQFRAMFVMGIEVNWQSMLVYDEKTENLVPKLQMAPVAAAAGPSQNDIGRVPIVDDDAHQRAHGQNLNNHSTRHIEDDDVEEEMYYSVHCNNCGTQVAALNMNDEVYHFFGCLASG